MTETEIEDEVRTAEFMRTITVLICALLLLMVCVLANETKKANPPAEIAEQGYNYGDFDKLRIEIIYDTFNESDVPRDPITRNGANYEFIGTMHLSDGRWAGIYESDKY